MFKRLIHIIGPLTETHVEPTQGPDGLRPRRNGFRHLPDMAHHLRVPLQVVDKTGVGRPKQALANRTETRLGTRTRFLGAFIAG